MKKQKDIEVDENLMKVAEATLAQEAKSEKPMFDSKDLLLEDTAKLRYDESVELKKDINELRQMIFQQGLERGIPREILNVINDVAHSISGINALWDSAKVIEKEEEEDKKIDMLLNQGNEIAAYSRKNVQTLRLREQRVELRGILYKLVYELQRLQKLMQSVDAMDSRRR